MKSSLDKIREKYGCKGELIFRTSVQYIIDYGKALLNDTKYIEGQLKNIDEKHNKAEAEGKVLWVGREFEKDLINCAVEIAKVNTIDIIKYIQKEWLFQEIDEMTYTHAKDLLINIINQKLSETDTDFARDELECAGFDDEDFEALGFAEIFNPEECE